MAEDFAKHLEQLHFRMNAMLGQAQERLRGFSAYVGLDDNREDRAEYREADGPRPGQTLDQWEEINELRLDQHHIDTNPASIQRDVSDYLDALDDRLDALQAEMEAHRERDHAHDQGMEY